MKKPTMGEADKLRALAEEADLMLLAKRYAAAKADEREAVLEEFNKIADALHPGWRETVKANERDGTILRATAINFLKGARARSDLTELDRLIVEEANADFKTIFDAYRVTYSLSPAAAERAFRMASAFGILASYALVRPEEVEIIRLQAVADHARKIGPKPKKDRPPRAYARLLYHALPEAVRDLPADDVASEIKNAWEGPKPPAWTGPKPRPPRHRTLADFVRRLRRLPPR